MTWTLFALTGRRRALFLTTSTNPWRRVREHLARLPSEPGREVKRLGALVDDGGRVAAWVGEMRRGISCPRSA